jgi:hypothetical protein
VAACTLAIALVTLARADVPQRPSGGAPRGRAGTVNLTLRQVEVRHSASVRPDRTGIAGKVTHDVEARLELRLSAASAPDVEAVLRGPNSPTARFRVVDDRGTEGRKVTAEVVEVDDEPLLRLTVTGLSPAATALRLVEGELTAYPQVRRVRFHIPWLKDEVPLSVDYQGARATLRRFQLIQEDSTLWVSVRPPEGFRVAPRSTPGAIAAQAVDHSGNLINRGGITEIEQTQSGAEPEFRLEAPGMRRTPDRLMLDVLCTSGEPRPLPFTLRDVPLPKR